MGQELIIQIHGAKCSCFNNFLHLKKSPMVFLNSRGHGETGKAPLLSCSCQSSEGKFSFGDGELL